MATMRTDKETTMTMQTTDTNAKTVNKTLRNMNPSLTDDKFLYFGNKYAALQKDTLASVHRTDKAVLVAE